MSDTKFDPKAEAGHVADWIAEHFRKTAAPDARAVIGISGGKDSTVTAALLVKALGKDRVLGVLMPDGMQDDLQGAKRVVSYLGIDAVLLDIGPVTAGALGAVAYATDPFTYAVRNVVLTNDVRINLPPRIRMAMLYAMAQSLPCGTRVANTCNLSEDWVGYSTKYGDSAGDFAPLQHYTATEVVAMGHALGLPADLVDKTPSDGLCGKSDEEKLGFSYAVLDEYIRTGKCDDIVVKMEIDRLHNANLHKLRLMPSCPRLCSEYAA